MPVFRKGQERMQGTKSRDNGRKLGLLDVIGLTEESLRSVNHVKCYREKSIRSKP